MLIKGPPTKNKLAGLINKGISTISRKLTPKPVYFLEHGLVNLLEKQAYSACFCMERWLEASIVIEEYQGVSLRPWIPESRTGAVTPSLQTKIVCLNKHSREEWHVLIAK